MNATSFWSHLEFRVFREMASVANCAEVGTWCDGFIPDLDGVELHANRIRGKAWVCLEQRQEHWSSELQTPSNISHRDEIRWEALLPAEKQTSWLSLDGSKQLLVLAPTEAVDVTTESVAQWSYGAWTTFTYSADDYARVPALAHLQRNAGLPKTRTVAGQRTAALAHTGEVVGSESLSRRLCCYGLSW